MSNRKNNSVSPTQKDDKLSISPSTKIKLIRKFQRIEGNVDCCASAYTRVCKQFVCLWRDDCQTMAQDPMAQG